MKTHAPLSRRCHQRGAVVVLFGVTLVLLIGFVGLAIDLGRFFVVKAELQNAMDACALAAASQLKPGQNDPNALTRAVAYGRVFTTGGTGNVEAIKNRVNFQSEAVAIAPNQITFSDTLNGSYQDSSTASYNTVRFAKCDYPLAGLPIYFMQVLNFMGSDFSTQTVSAMAVATTGRQVCNVIPAGICERAASTATPPHGLNDGEWISIGTTMAPGWFGWIDYSATAGGTSEVKAALTETGQCNLPVVGTNAPESGAKTSAEDAWNTRFGIYSNPFKISDIGNTPPDKTGYAYFGQNVGTGVNALVANWPRLDTDTAPRAYDGELSPGQTNPPNFQRAAAGLHPYEQTTKIFSGSVTLATGGTGGQLDEYGRMDRRLIVAPVMNCSTMKITGHACALMLNPFGRVTGPGGGPINGKLEYLGLVEAANSPCGNANVTGPYMSVLVK